MHGEEGGRGEDEGLTMLKHGPGAFIDLFCSFLALSLGEYEFHGHEFRLTKRCLYLSMIIYFE